MQKQVLLLYFNVAGIRFIIRHQNKKKHPNTGTGPGTSYSIIEAYSSYNICLEL